MKLAISEVLPNLMQDAECDGSFQVIYLADKLCELKKISWGALDVLNHMERSNGPINGVIKDFEFHYLHIELDKEIWDDDLEGNTLKNIHFLINKELSFLKAFLIGEVENKATNIEGETK